ncbi:MAG: hypothetical protein A2170_17120 [Deltaproteobacteria bacterium RBG_13_53_10]|nr:MAG: hypothetical protein A2170_17120 [Deltaproteobacteria bacterium RBG_13_53_10]
MINGPYSLVALRNAKGIFYVGQLHVDLPEAMRISFRPIRAQEATSPRIQRPYITFFFFTEINAEMTILSISPFFHVNTKRKGLPILSQQSFLLFFNTLSDRIVSSGPAFLYANVSVGNRWITPSACSADL